MARMRGVLIVVVLIVVAGLIGGCSYNKFTTQEEAVKGAVGAGREPAAAAERPDPESRRDGERASRSRNATSSRRSPMRARRWRAPDAGRQDRGRQRGVERARPAARGGRELSAAQVRRELRALDGRAGRHREPARRPSACATTSSVQELQHDGAAVPGQRDREDVRLQGRPVFRSAGRSEGVAEGGLQEG